MNGDSAFPHSSFEFGGARGRERLHVGVVGVAEKTRQDVALMRLLLVGDREIGIHVFPRFGSIAQSSSVVTAFAKDSGMGEIRKEGGRRKEEGGREVTCARCDRGCSGG